MRNLLFLPFFLFCCWQASGQDYLQQANACFEKGDYECAKQKYTLFKEYDGSRDVSAQIQAADECFKILIAAEANFKDKEYEKARDRYKSVLDKNPKDAYAKQQYDECVKQIQLVIITLTVSPKELSFSSSEDTAFVSVTTNTGNYDITSLPSWCLIISKKSDGFSFRCNAWTGNSPREDYFYVKVNDKSEKITVVQKAASTFLVKEEINYVPNVVFFRIGSSVIDANQQISIYNTATFLKTTNETIRITGYADKDEGTSKNALKIAEKRAKAVARELVTKYNIDSYRVTVDWKGFYERPYPQNNWNRIVIMSSTKE